MELQVPYDINALAIPGQTSNYNFTRAIIESSEYGAHHFVTEGELIARVNNSESTKSTTIATDYNP